MNMEGKNINFFQKFYSCKRKHYSFNSNDDGGILPVQSTLKKEYRNELK